MLKTDTELQSLPHNVETADDTDGLIVSDHDDVMDMPIHHISCDHGQFSLG